MAGPATKDRRFALAAQALELAVSSASSPTVATRRLSGGMARSSIKFRRAFQEHVGVAPAVYRRIFTAA